MIQEPDKVGAMIDALEAKQAERSALLRVLRVWVEVARQGIDTDEVAGFGFQDCGVSPEYLRDYRRKNRLPGTDGDLLDRLAREHYNRVTLKSGETRLLEPMIRRPAP